MRVADFKAKIRKIEITNKALTNEWQQSIRVILADIDLTNENLLELRRFKPHENVFITIQADQQQLSLFPGGAGSGEGDNLDDREKTQGDDDSFVNISEDEEPIAGKVAKAWNF